MTVDLTQIAASQSSDSEIQELRSKAAKHPLVDVTRVQYVIENELLFHSVPDSRPEAPAGYT